MRLILLHGLRPSGRPLPRYEYDLLHPIVLGEDQLEHTISESIQPNEHASGSFQNTAYNATAIHAVVITATSIMCLFGFLLLAIKLSDIINSSENSYQVKLSKQFQADMQSEFAAHPDHYKYGEVARRLLGLPSMPKHPAGRELLIHLGYRNADDLNRLMLCLEFQFCVTPNWSILLPTLATAPDNGR